MSATEKLARLLEKAGLPLEKECIGKMFTFTWADDEDRQHRAVARIDGLEFEEGGPDGYDQFAIIASLLRRRRQANCPPTIYFYDEHESYGDSIEPAQWKIYFGDLRPMEQSGPGNRQIFDGQFELL